AGEEIAVLHTNFGKIAIRLFPEGAPKTVENFKALIQKGYYNGLTFHRIINDFMIQTGDPKGDGTGGESHTGTPVIDEFDEKLLNLRGSLAMANSGKENQNGSQFFINQNTKNNYTESGCEENLASYKKNYSEAAAAYKEYYEFYESQMKAYFASWEEYFAVSYNLAPIPGVVPEKVWELYNQKGGNIHLDGAWLIYGGHTVFGQVFDGMDVVDAIAAVETGENSDAPLYLVTIDKAEIITYDPATYEASVLLTPELTPVEPKPDENAPPFPMGEAQTSTEHVIGDAYPDRDYGFQLEPPAEGEEIAVLHTKKGDIRIRLFPEAAPKTVAFFKELITSGKMSGLSFDYVMEEFIVQVGEVTKHMEGYLPDEFDKKLLNLRGALAMGNYGIQNTGNGQFFINQTTVQSETATESYWQENETQFNAMYDSTVNQYKAYYKENKDALKAYYPTEELYLTANVTLAPRMGWVTNAVWSVYEENGGNIHLDGAFRDYGGNTVFGQVFEGIALVDEMAAAETDEQGVPKEPVVIESAELVTYKK
ncbi:MAG: peptidylprolyl isomerase, partial [Clostridia bacterium]|nr:peptidylprolyl isomerase [Clostridia bacterium]